MWQVLYELYSKYGRDEVLRNGFQVLSASFRMRFSLDSYLWFIFSGRILQLDSWSVVCSFQSSSLVLFHWLYTFKQIDIQVH